MRYVFLCYKKTKNALLQRSLEGSGKGSGTTRLTATATTRVQGKAEACWLRSAWWDIDRKWSGKGKGKRRGREGGGEGGEGEDVVLAVKECLEEEGERETCWLCSALSTRIQVRIRRNVCTPVVGCACVRACGGWGGSVDESDMRMPVHACACIRRARA